MTTLDDFKASLNANPEFTDALLILADWCDEHGEPWGEGYRALGALGLYPWWFSSSLCWGWVRPGWIQGQRNIDHGRLPDDWFGAVESNKHVRLSSNREVKHTPDHTCDRIKPFVLFKAAAKAFCSLPAARRAELLAATPAGS